MRLKLLLSLILSATGLCAQNYTANNIIEGGKALVDLIRVLKIPKTSLAQPNIIEKKDSCITKGICDLCIKNSTIWSIQISLYRRSGNGYEPGVLNAMILPKNQECWYELKSGVYKYKIETEVGGTMKIFREGELKLNACANMLKEIREN